MKNNIPTVSTCPKSSPFLQRAHVLMSEYAQATGAYICINDHNYLPIPELLGSLLTEKNACLFCLRYRKQIEAANIQDIAVNPCREMHINAIAESHRLGGSHIYSCPIGFTFWTSPVFHNGRFSGALFGSGFLETDSGETFEKMCSICKESLSEAELKQFLTRFPQAEPHRIKAMAELMLVCAQSVSAGSGGCHLTMQRRCEQQSNLSAEISELKNQHKPGSPKPAYPLEKERKLLEALRRGDAESGKKILNEILAVLVFTYQDQFKYIQYRAIELAVVLFRIDTNLGFTVKTILETNNIEELTDILYRIVDDLGRHIFNFQKIQHASTLKNAENYILENFTRKISLGEIARTAGFSTPYFSTIFKKEMGENLSSYINRLRVEKAWFMLKDTNLSLSKIAQDCGFEDQSWFSKIFKFYTGMSPGKYRSLREKHISKIPETGFSQDYMNFIQ